MSILFPNEEIKPAVQQQATDEQIVQIKEEESLFDKWVIKHLDFLREQHKKYIRKYWFPFWR